MAMVADVTKEVKDNFAWCSHYQLYKVWNALATAFPQLDNVKQLAKVLGVPHSCQHFSNNNFRAYQVIHRCRKALC